MEIRIPIHSMIDVITNSSTEIFVSTSESSIESVKGLLQDVINLGGGDKKVDDIFDFSIEDDGEESWTGYSQNDLIIKVKEGIPDRDQYGNIAKRFLNIFSIDACYDG